MASPPSGLRERKKAQTRRLIADTANRLFAERGFDAVTVADVAREADVSIGTVFNYFPTKEGLFYDGMVAFEQALVEAVRARPAGETALDAVRRLMLGNTDRLATEEVAAAIRGAARVVTGSPSLLAREREILAEASDALAAVLREETGAGPADTAPDVAAHALMGVQRAVVAWLRARVLEGHHGPQLAADARAEIAAAFALLERGLGRYALRRP